MDTDGLISVNYVIASLLNDLGFDDREFERLKQWVYEAYTELNMFGYLNSFKTVRLTMSDINTVSLPKDYIDYEAIGINNGGVLWTFTRQENLILPTTISCGEESLDSSIGEGGDLNDDIVGSYGMPGGVNTNYFKVDKRNWRIVFSGSVTRSEVILVYKSTGVSLDTETMIPRRALLSLKAYCDWMRIENDDRISENRKIKKESVWEYEKKRLSRYEKSPTIDEIKDIIYSGYSQTAKR